MTVYREDKILSRWKDLSLNFVGFSITYRSCIINTDSFAEFGYITVYSNYNNFSIIHFEKLCIYGKFGNVTSAQKYVDTELEKIGFVLVEKTNMAGII